MSPFIDLCRGKQKTRRTINHNNDQWIYNRGQLQLVWESVDFADWRLSYRATSCFDQAVSHHAECCEYPLHDDVIKWKHFPRYWPFVRGIHRFPVNSPHKGQWRGALMCSLICVWINGWVNNGKAGDLRGYRAHYDVTVMNIELWTFSSP